MTGLLRFGVNRIAFRDEADGDGKRQRDGRQRDPTATGLLQTRPALSRALGRGSLPGEI